MTLSIALDQHRCAIIELVGQFRAINPRVCGSVLHASDTDGNDLDLLVDALPETTLFDLGGLQVALEDLLGVRVSLLIPGDLPSTVREQVLSGARPL